MEVLSSIINQTINVGTILVIGMLLGPFVVPADIYAGFIQQWMLSVRFFFPALPLIPDSLLICGLCPNHNFTISPMTPPLQC